MKVDTKFMQKVVFAFVEHPRYFVTGFDILQQLGLKDTPENQELLKAYLALLKDGGYVEETCAYLRLTSKGYDLVYEPVF